jgi:PAS domain S-box-containing protein
MRSTSLVYKILIFFLIVSLLPLVCISFANHTRLSKYIDILIHEHLVILVHTIKLDIDRTIDSALSHINNLAENPVIQSQQTSIDEKLLEIKRIEAFYSTFEDITLINLEGRVLTSTQYIYRGLWGPKKWFQDAKAGKLAISPVHTILQPFRLVTVVTAPVYGENGHITSVIAGQVNLKSIWEIIDKIKLGETGYLFITDDEGNLLAYPDKTKLLYQIPSPLLLERIKNNQLGFIAYQDSDGTAKICYLQALKESDNHHTQVGWKIGIIQDQQEAYAIINQVNRYTVIVGIGVLVLIAIMSGLLSRHIVKPLMTLVAATRKIAEKGDLEHPLQIVSHDEIGELGYAFNQMITKLRQSREELIKEKERLTVTLRSITDGVITTTVDGTVVLVNRIAETLTGWTQKSAIGCNILNVFDVRDEENHLLTESLLNQAVSTDVIASIPRGILLNNSGRKHLITVSTAPIKDQHNHILGIILVFSDITEKEKMRENLLKGQKLESLGVLAGGIAHDFNNILTSIVTNISFAQMNTSPEDENYSILLAAEKEAFRARHLTQQLLTFSRGGAPIKQLTSLKEIIVDCVKFILSGSQSTCHFEIADDLWPLEIDPGQITQVAQNLVLNADQAMPEGGLIEIKAENVRVTTDDRLPLSAGCYIKVSIKDQGVGIPPQYLSKIFDPYFTTKQKGNGLGLSTVYSVIRKHDGYIYVDSELGKGTSFHFYLKASPDQTIHKKTTEDKPSISGSGKILLMDDEPAILTVSKLLLLRFGYEVVTTTNGEEALEQYKKAKISKNPFDAIILDLTIRGGMGGEETIKQLLAFDPQVKAIVSSGYANAPIMGQFAQYGFQAVIKKPFQIKELHATLKQILKR